MQKTVQKFIEAANARTDVKSARFVESIGGALGFEIKRRNGEVVTCTVPPGGQQTFGEILDEALGIEPDPGHRDAQWHHWRETLFDMRYTVG